MKSSVVAAFLEGESGFGGKQINQSADPHVAIQLVFFPRP